MQWFTLLSLSLLSLSGYQAENDGKLDVEVYYETLNGKVRAFFVEQLRPVVIEDTLWDKINLKLIPYGNTKIDNKGQYTCPFGELQCRANRLHVSLVNLFINNNNHEIQFSRHVFLNKLKMALVYPKT